MTNAKVRGAYHKFCTNCYIFRTKNHEIIKQVYFLTISPCKSMHFLQHSATFYIPSSNQSFDMALSTSFTADFSSFLHPNLLPQGESFSGPNRWKSLGARSGL